MLANARAPQSAPAAGVRADARAPAVLAHAPAVVILADDADAPRSSLHLLDAVVLGHCCLMIRELCLENGNRDQT